MNTTNWSLGLADGAVGWTTCSDARVDGIGEDVATSMVATPLRGTVEEGGVAKGGMDWGGRSGGACLGL